MTKKDLGEGRMGISTRAQHLSSHKRVHHGFVRNKAERKTDVQSCQPERSFQLWATGNSHGLLKRETTQLGLIEQTFTACLSHFLLWIT